MTMTLQKINKTPPLDAHQYLTKWLEGQNIVSFLWSKFLELS